MKKHPEITAATKEAFIDAFCILSKRKSFEKITIQELSRKAGFNRCTFYQYFADIYELLEHIENIVVAHVKENFRNNISQENFMQTFLRLTVDKIFGAKNASIYGEKGDFCPVRGDFHGDFSALTGGFSRGKGRDRHGNRISTKGRDRHGETRGKNRRIAGKAGGDCLTRGKQAGNRQGQAGQAETGKRQHNRVLCGLLRLKSNITSKQPYPSHPTS